MASARRPPFSVAVRRVVRGRDCLALGVVPAVLVGVYLLPEPFRRSLAFSYSEPEPVTAFAAHYVHFAPEHLLANLVGYVVLAGCGYLLSALADCRRLFGVAAATYLLAFPPILSALNLAVPRHAVGYGFSGIVMAFAGLLPVVLAVYAGRRLDARVRPRHAPAPFFAALTLVALSLPRTRLTLGLVGAAGIVTTGYVTSLVSALGTDGSGAGRLAGPRRGWIDGLVVGTAAVLGYVVVGFSAAPVVRGGVVNRYVHLLGFCLAFIVPYVGVELGLFDVDGVAGR